MNDDVKKAIKRLEEAIALFRAQDGTDWYAAYRSADEKADGDDSGEWAAIRDLIVVASHGAPHELSYLDEELRALIDRDRD